MRKWTVLLWLPVLLLAGILAPCVFATGWTIQDGGRVYSTVGFSRNPEKALASAGLELSSIAAYSRKEQTITVHRNPRIEVLYHGTPISVEIQGQTAGQLLEELGLVPDRWDRLNMPEETVLAPGMALQVDHVVCREEHSSRRIPFETEVYYAPELPAGTQQVLREGRDGELSVSQSVSYVNFNEASRETLAEKQTRAPRSRVVALGTGGVGRARKAEDPIILEDRILLPTGEILHYTKVDFVRATAYTHTDPGCTVTTATGTRVHRGTVAVDPRYIPYGTRMFIMASDGSYVYGPAEAEDCGGDIKGDRVDLYLPTVEACMAFGRRRCTVYFLG